jgi:Niemann-Pick C1 protein
VIALLNIGWKFFVVETDPVRLWVSPGSESAYQKKFFDETFGPFYRAEQIFVMGRPAGYDADVDGLDVHASRLPPPSPVLTYDNLDWWLKHEQEINNLKSEPNGYTLQDICFAPAGPGTPCVVQSVSAWLGYDMQEWGEDWTERLLNCAGSPGECLPEFGQPIEAKFILGGAENKDLLSAKSLVINYVVGDSLDSEKRAKAEEWERTLRSYLADLQRRAPGEASVQLAFSTGVSLEEELNKVRPRV